MICQIDATAATPSPGQTFDPQQDVKEGKAKSLGGDGSCHPPCPNILHLVMEQCKLQLNEQGGLVLTNINSPSISATMGFKAPRALPTGFDLGVAGELHHALVT